MTSNDTIADNERITSCTWVGEYKNDEASPANPNAVFSEGGDDVPIPSMDPALHLASMPSSRLATLDSFILNSRISSGGSGSGFDWLQNIVNSASVTNSTNPAERISTVDLLTKTVLGDDEPTLSPEHDAKDNVEPDASIEPTVASKPVAMADAAAAAGRSTTKEYVDENDVHQWDILSERGGKANHHEGNKRYRKVVSEMKKQYRGIEAKTEKTDLSRKIVAHVRNYGGRFLKKGKDGRYFVMTDAEARKKTSQALRETKQLKWTDVDVQDRVQV
jgi:hypothetical protein